MYLESLRVVDESWFAFEAPDRVPSSEFAVIDTNQ